MMKTRNVKTRLLTLMLFSFLMGILLSSSVMAAAAAKIGKKSYKTVSEAFENVKNGQTIVLQGNTTMNSNEYAGLRISGKCTLDLNKKTLLMKGNAQICVEQGTLIVKNGAIKKTSRTGRILYSSGPKSTLRIAGGTYTGSICAQEKSKLFIEGGTFKAIKTNNVELLTVTDGATAVISKGTFSGNPNTALIANYNSKLSVKGGTFRYTRPFDEEYTDTFSPEWSNGSLLYTEGESSQTIVSGGSFNSTTICFFNTSGATVKVTKGTVVCKSGGCVLNDGPKLVQISGGSFKCSKDWGILYHYGGKCSITGGMFKSEWTVLESSGGTLTVTGGTFSTTVNNMVAAVLVFGGTAKINGGTYIAPKTYGYWLGEGKLTVSKKANFKKTKGKKSGDLWD